jgi:hypothetical protein
MILSLHNFLGPGTAVYYPDKRDLQKSIHSMERKNHASFIKDYFKASVTPPLPA